MIGGFFLAIFSGHIYVIAIVTTVQIVSFKEVIAIANVPSKAKNLRFTKSLNWYFLAVTMYFLYGESVIYYFKHILLVDRMLLPFATHHRFISFVLYMMGKCQRSLLHCTNHESWTSNNTQLMGRFCLLRCFLAKATLQIPVYPVRLVPYGPLSHRCASPIYHE